MSKLLDEAIRRLRQLPEPMQDSAARAVILQLEEHPEPGDRRAIEEGRRDFERGDFVTLDQLQHEMGLGVVIVISRFPTLVYSWHLAIVRVR